MMKLHRSGITFALFAVCAALPVQAQNIVKDGDFEQTSAGTLFGSDPSADNTVFDAFWTIQNNVGLDSGNGYVFAGNQSLLLTGDNSQFTDGITQSLDTIDHQYLLSFEANADGPNTFAVLFGGLTVSGSPFSIPANGFLLDPSTHNPGANASQFTAYSFLVTTTTPSTDLAFQGSSDSSIELDNNA